MAQIFPIDFSEKTTIAQNDYILFSDSEDGNKIKKAQYSNLKWEKWDTGATWPQWPQWETWPQWPQGETWPQWEQGEKWDTWETWATWARINSAAFSGNDIVFWETDWNTVTLANAKTTLTWPQWPQWEQGIQWEQWIQGIQWEQWVKWDTWAKINSASFSGDDMVFWLTDSSTVTLTWAKTTLTWPQGEQGIQGIQWPQGETWATGTAATITVWSTSTWLPWTSASVENAWTTSAAVLNFTIPQWAKWDTWATGQTWATGNGIASVTSEKSWKVTTVTITETNWDDYSFHVLDWADWEWSGDVVWPSSSVNGNVVLFDGTSWKLIKDSWKTIPATASDVNALPDSTKYWASITVSVDTTDYKITTTLKDQDWNTLGTAQVIDLPLESVVVSWSYDSVNKKVVLTLENGNTIEFSVADLVAGLQSEITSSNKLDADLVDDSTSTNKFVTAANKTTWNWKQDALIAWTNIQIAADWKTISATDTTYSAASSSTLWLVKLWDDTVQSVAANAVSWTASRTYAMQVNSSWQLVVNIPWTDTTYTASDFDIKNLADSTGLRTTWSNKQDALATQTAYTSKGTSTKVPTITTNTLGQVTWITETSIAFPVTSVNGSTWAVKVDPWITKVFTLPYDITTAEALAVAQEAYDWYVAWNYPVIYREQAQRYYFIWRIQSTRIPFYQVQTVFSSSSMEVVWNSSISQDKMVFALSSWTVTEITASTDSKQVLAIWIDYANPYTPEYDWSPATKKYVDDHWVPTVWSNGQVLTVVSWAAAWANAPATWIQLAPNSPLTPPYHWYGTDAQYQALSQYYTDTPGDTVYYTV